MSHEKKSHLTDDQFEQQSGISIYKLPNDLRLHRALLYQSDDYVETYYFNAFLKEKDPKGRGREWALFYLINQQGYNPATGQPYTMLWSTLYELPSSRTHPKSCYTSQALGDAIHRTNPGPSYFDYEFDLGSLQTNVTFYGASGAGSFRFRFSNHGAQGVKELGFDLTLDIEPPGIITPVPTGIIPMGAAREPNQRHNPASMYALSYYLLIPRTKITTGWLRLDGEDKPSIPVEGTAWMERQWGNYRAPDQYHFCWHWVGFSVDKEGGGSEGVSFQRFFIPDTGEGNAHQGNEKETVEFNSRVHTFDGEGRVSYGGSDSFSIERCEWRKSRLSGKYIPMKFELKVGEQSYTVTVMSEDYDSPIPTLKDGLIKNAPLWTGPVQVEWDVGSQKRTARGFMEYYLGGSGGDVNTRGKDGQRASAPRDLATGMWVR